MITFVGDLGPVPTMHCLGSGLTTGSCQVSSVQDGVTEVQTVTTSSADHSVPEI